MLASLLPNSSFQSTTLPTQGTPLGWHGLLIMVVAISGVLVTLVWCYGSILRRPPPD